MSIYVRAQFEVRDDQASDFDQVAKAMTEAAEAEPGTISFRWFASPDPGTYFALEQYKDSAAFLTHAEHSGELLSRLMAAADMIALELYGTLDDALHTWAGTLPQAVVYPDAPLGD
jgi:quinol monooxygenase YgiN